MNKDRKNIKKVLREGLLKEAEPDQKIIDRLLDKINVKGKGSLKPSEKEYLDQASQGEVSDEVADALDYEPDEYEVLEDIKKIVAKFADEAYQQKAEEIINLQKDPSRMEAYLASEIAKGLNNNYSNINAASIENRQENEPYFKTVFSIKGMGEYNGVYEVYVDHMEYQTYDGELEKNVSISKDEVVLRKKDKDPDNISKYVEMF